MKKRLDVLLTERGMVNSRNAATPLIMSNRVLVDGHPVTKPGAQISELADITLIEPLHPFVSRGGVKLDHALKHFMIDVQTKVALDIGASTGGFTDCLLQNGALRVYAIDVGYGQLHWKIRNDPRVITIERTNIRYLERDKIPDCAEIAVMDVSFISLKIVIPAVLPFLCPTSTLIALIKPQFEVGKGEVGKGGIVRDELKRQEVVNDITAFMSEAGFTVRGVCESPIKGQKGNTEYIIAGTIS